MVPPQLPGETGSLVNMGTQALPPTDCQKFGGGTGKSCFFFKFLFFSGAKDPEVPSSHE